MARQRHPDTAGAGSGAEMAAVNEAWRVLSDPARRAVYDASLRGRPVPRLPSPAASAGDLDDPSGFVPLKHPLARFGVPLPWVLVLVTLAVIFVFTAYAVRPRSGDGGDKVDGVLRVGSCVTVAAVGAVTETGCGQPNDGRVVEMPAPGLYCGDGTQAYVDGRTNRVVCVRG